MIMNVNTLHGNGKISSTFVRRYPEFITWEVQHIFQKAINFFSNHNSNYFNDVIQNVVGNVEHRDYEIIPKCCSLLIRLLCGAFSCSASSTAKSSGWKSIKNHYLYHWCLELFVQL